MSRLAIGGRFHWQALTRDGRLRARGSFPNAITTLGINGLLDSYFRGEAAPAGFYLGVIDATDYTGLASNDTLASHAGWVELTDYDEAARPAWTPGAAASGLLTAPTACEFTVSAAVTAKGLLVATDDTKGGTTGVLWAHGLFDTEQVFQVGETLRCYYELLARSG